MNNTICTVVSVKDAFNLWNKGGFTYMVVRGYGIISFDSPSICKVIVFGSYLGYEDEMFHHIMELKETEEVTVYLG